MAMTYNHDVAGLARHINRFVYELVHAVSANSSATNSYDLSRVHSYLDAIDSYHQWVISHPQLDLPETHPRGIEIEDVPAAEKIENESINDLAYLLTLARDELLNSQSSRHGSGLNKFDSARLTATVAKARAFLQNYVETVTPLDLPESSPLRDGVEPGRGGV